jgi:hypothetical protein
MAEREQASVRGLIFAIRIFGGAAGITAALRS